MQKLSSTVRKCSMSSNSLHAARELWNSLFSVSGLPISKEWSCSVSSTVQICCHAWHGTTQMLFQGKHCSVLVFHLLLYQQWFKRVWGSPVRALNYTANSILHEHVSWLSLMTCFCGRAATISSFLPTVDFSELGEFPWGEMLSAQGKERDQIKRIHGDPAEKSRSPSEL